MNTPKEKTWDIKPPEESAEESFGEIYSCLVDAAKYGQQIEVVWSALKAMKENPTLSIGDAMTCGYSDWIK